MKFKIKYADQVVGLFVILSIVALGVVIILLGINQRWFAKNYYFRTEFGSSAGIAPGTSLLMRGFTVGKIDRVTLNQRNQVDVSFYIYDTYIDKVRENSLVELSVSPIGLGSQLLFHPGLSDVYLEEGGLIYSTDMEQGWVIMDEGLADIPPKDDTITRLLFNINPVLENANRTLASINRTLTEVNRALAGQSTGPLGGILGDIQASTARIPRTIDTVDGILVDSQSRLGQVLDQVDGILLGANETVENVAAITSNLEVTTAALQDPTGLVPRLLDPSGSLKTFLDDDNQLFDSVMVMMDDLERSVRTVRTMISSVNNEVPRLSALLSETQTTIELSQDVLEGLRNNPLIRGGIPERDVQETLYNSMRVRSFE